MIFRETIQAFFCFKNKRLNMPVNQSVIFFDGHCKLCHRAVRFVIKHDKTKKFRFAPLQSDSARNALSGIQMYKQNPDSIVYLENKKIYQHSTATLRVMKNLGRGWQLLYAFIIIPPFIRDWFYMLISRNRTRWFGRYEHCSIVPPDRMLRWFKQCAGTRRISMFLN